MPSYAEPRVFLPLKAGVVPFPLAGVADSNPDFIYVHKIKPYTLEDEDEDTPRARSKLVERLSRFKLPAFRRTIKEVPSSEFVWQTAESNWRPGLVTLEQAAQREAIVRRPEAFEKLSAERGEDTGKDGPRDGDGCRTSRSWTLLDSSAWPGAW